MSDHVFRPPVFLATLHEDKPSTATGGNEFMYSGVGYINRSYRIKMGAL